MRKPKIKMQILKEDKGYSAFVNIGADFIGTQGNNFEELKINVLDAVNLYAGDKGLSYTIDEIQFELELPSFFEFYKVINAKALSERIGINQSLLAQYIKGVKKPSPAQTKRILKGVQQVGRELAAVQFV
ncbi:MAG: helix-turn-helix transcriptional regulator [Chitinophagaceae bacterium]|nr:helix-turn-helix transcriptional regulator [Chitinophagaceae bacterium]